MSFELALLELYMPLKHGVLQPIHASKLYGNYIVIERVPIDTFYNQVKKVTKQLKHIKKEYNIYLDKLKYEMNITSLHPFIRNYEEIIKNPKHYKIEIIQPTTTSIGENEWDQYSTALVKTHWLRLIQRRWRAFLKTRNKEMKNLVNLKHREVTGRFPNHCTTKFQLGIQ
jgi:flagellar biosynthesis chaperone FliJ